MNRPSFEEILADYLADVDAGASPDRDAILADHPDPPAAHRAFFANGDRLDSLAAPFREDPANDETMLVGAATNSATMPDAIDLPAGSRLQYFGDYEILKELGRGGMGVVFKAKQVSLGRLVALKLIRAAELASEDDLRRFQNEAEAVAGLDHPGIVPIIEVGDHEGRKYFSMKLVVGRGLDDLKSRYRDDPRAAARLLADVARAVHHAHQRGILHRDLKPSNILVDEEQRPHVTDFGLAKRVEADAGMTQSGAIMGTPSYMAPEQASGKRGSVTTASDVYGLGAVLYDLLAGGPPFGEDSVLETLVAVQEREPSPIRPRNPKVDRDLETICLKCLEKDQRLRYKSAEALADDLDRWLAGQPIAARPVTAMERAWKWARRHPAIAGLAAGLAAAVVVGLAGISLLYLRAESQRRMAIEARNEAMMAEASSRVARDLEAKARTEAEASGRAAIESRDRAEAGLYVNRINLAQQYWQNGNVGQSDRILDACPEPLRRWEWRYLKRLDHPELFTLPGNGQFTSGLSFNRDGRRMAAFASSGDAGVQVWDLASRKPLSTVSLMATRLGRTFTACAMAPDGSAFALGDQAGQVTLFDAATGKPVREIGGLDGGVNSLAFSPDGKLLAAARFDSQDGAPLIPALAPRRKMGLKVWKLDGGAVVFNPPDVGVAAAFSPDGRYLLAFKRNTALRIDPRTPELLGALWRTSEWSELRTLGAVRLLVVRRDGPQRSPWRRRGAESARKPSLRVEEVETGRPIASVRPEHDVGDIALSPDGSTAAVARRFRPEFDLWDVKTGKVARTFRGHTGWLNAVAFAPDGKTLATCAWDRTIRFWDPSADPIAHRPTTARPVVYASDAAFRPDGKEVAIVQGENVASPSTRRRERHQPSSTRKRRARPPGRSPAHNAPRRVAYSADGRVLVSGGRDGKARAWDALSGAPLGTFVHPGWVTDVVASHDGRWAASAHEPKEFTEMRRTGRFSAGTFTGELTVWDARTGAVRRAIRDLPGRVVHARCPPVRRKTSWSTADGDGVRLWDLATGQPRWHGPRPPPATRWPSRPPTAPMLAVVGGPEITLIDAKTGEVRARSSSGEATAPFGGLAFSPDGRRIATARGQEVKLWEVPGGGEILTLPRPAAAGGVTPSPLAALAFGPDGHRLLNVDRYGLIEVWDAGPPGGE